MSTSYVYIRTGGMLYSVSDRAEVKLQTHSYRNRQNTCIRTYVYVLLGQWSCSRISISKMVDESLEILSLQEVPNSNPVSTIGCHVVFVVILSDSDVMAGLYIQSGQERSRSHRFCTEHAHKHVRLSCVIRGDQAQMEGVDVHRVRRRSAETCRF